MKISYFFMVLFGVVLLFGVSCRSIQVAEIGESFDDVGMADYGFGDQDSISAQYRWWEVFASSELNDLIDRALVGNTGMREAIARLEQAGASAERLGAVRQISVTGSGSGLAGYTYRRELPNVSYEEFQLGLSANYEIDFWGRLRAGQSAAVMQEQASVFDLQTVAMTLSAEIADRWLQILGAREHLSVIENQFALADMQLQVLERRFASGQATALDLFQQKQTLKRLETARIPIETNIKLLENQIAVLCGDVPGDLKISGLVLPELPAIPEVGLPFDLLRNRPDLLAARSRLVATQWGVVAADADRYPVFRISAGLNLRSGELAKILDNWMSTLAAQMTAPLFDGGAREAEVRRQSALVQERTANFRGQVLNAINDVRSALIQEQGFELQLASQEAELDLARRTLQESLRRYEVGLVDYLAVLQAQNNLYSLEISQLAVRNNWIRARVRLYRSLGGVVDFVNDEVE